MTGPSGNALAAGCACNRQRTVLRLVHVGRSALQIQRRRSLVDINSNQIDNAKGPAVWYTNPFGYEGQTKPFPGSLKQYIAPIAGVLNPDGPGLGHRRNYGGIGVRAPN